jgi:inner membrane protein
LDNLTHSLVGLFLARAGFKRATPAGTAILVVAANAPDIDVVSWFWGRPTWLHWHRNITHSLAGAPVMAIATVALIALLSRKKIRWWQAFLIALLGVASHLLLDLTNVYGVRLLLPFSGQWSHLDTTPVVDFAIWAILLLGVVAPTLSRLVGSEIGEPAPDRGNAGWAVAALLLVTLYDYSRSVFHERAVNIVDSHIFNRYAPRRAGAFPTANPLVWRGMAELSYGYADVPVDLRTAFHPADALIYYKPPRTAAMRAAMATYPFQMLLEFVQYPLWVVEPVLDANGDMRVSLIDLRFGSPSQSGFAATAIVDAQNRVVESSFGLGEVRPR